VHVILSTKSITSKRRTTTYRSARPSQLLEGQTLGELEEQPRGEGISRIPRRFILMCRGWQK